MNTEDIIRMARKAGIAKYGLGWTCWEGQLERFVDIVAAAEREACAKVCEEHPDGLNMMGGAFVTCAKAIRARGGN